MPGAVAAHIGAPRKRLSLVGMSALPVVDMTLLGSDPGSFDTALAGAAHRVGFFYLLGHGIAPVRMAEVLATAREFFALPQADKDALAMVNSPHFHGYTRLGGEFTRGAVDWREQIDLGPQAPAPSGPGPDYRNLLGPNQWPAALPRLREVIEAWDADLARVSMTLLRAWARSLGAAADAFDAAFATDPATLIKIVRYPAGTDSAQGVGAHKDSGVLTLLLVEPDSAGLQVRPAGAREWIDAPPLDGAFIVNIGEMLEVATDGYLQATDHRVVNRRTGADRLSVPYFFNPSVTARMPHIPPPRGGLPARGLHRPRQPDFRHLRRECLEVEAASPPGRRGAALPGVSRSPAPAHDPA